MHENKDGKVRLVKGQNGGLNLRIPKKIAENANLSKGDIAEFTTSEDITLIKIKKA